MENHKSEIRPLWILATFLVAALVAALWHHRGVMLGDHQDPVAETGLDVNCHEEVYMYSFTCIYMHL